MQILLERYYEFMLAQMTLPVPEIPLGGTIKFEGDLEESGLLELEALMLGRSLQRHWGKR